MNPKKILIVDDSTIILKALSMKLKLAGYAVFTAQDGAEAVSLARREQPNLILLDASPAPRCTVRPITSAQSRAPRRQASLLGVLVEFFGQLRGGLGRFGLAVEKNLVGAQELTVIGDVGVGVGRE